jgi:hypothetical protein
MLIIAFVKRGFIIAFTFLKINKNLIEVFDFIRADFNPPFKFILYNFIYPLL